MSCYPTFAIKQMVADLAADSNTGKDPAAVVWNNASRGKKHGGVDVVTYSWTEVVYLANSGSMRLLDLLESYTKVMDGAEVFVIASMTTRIS
jgi:hypothetical protein